METTDDTMRQPCNPSEAEEFSRLLLAGYPNAAPKDPELYLGMIAAVFLNYPFGLVKRAVSPATGIPRKHKEYPPSAGEVEDWLRGADEEDESVPSYGEPDKAVLKAEWDDILAMVNNDAGVLSTVRQMGFRKAKQYYTQKLGIRLRRYDTRS